MHHHTINSKLPTSHSRNSKEFNNGGNSSEDDLYSVLDADGRFTARQSLSPSSLSSSSLNSSMNANKHKSLSGSAFANSPIPYNNSTSSLVNGQTNGNKIVYVTVSNGQPVSQNRSNSMPRNNMQLNAEQTSLINPPLPPRSSQIFSQSKLSLESGIETDFGDSLTTSSKPVLPKRINKKTTVLTTPDQPAMLISIDIDKNKPSMNTVISSNATYIESTNLDDIPPPLPSKKKRLPTSRSTTIININNNDPDANGLTINGSLLTANPLHNGLTNGGLINNHLINSSLINSNLINNNLINNNLITHLHSENNSLKSSSSTMSTSSSTNEYLFTETSVSGTTTTTTVSSNSSSKMETIHHQIQNLSLNDVKDH